MSTDLSKDFLLVIESLRYDNILGPKIAPCFSGIPYEQRVALQDQLTRLIMRVIMKYPHLCYYQVSMDIID